MTAGPLIDELIATGRRFAASGMAHGSSGNLSVRLPDGRLVMTPTGGSLGELTADTLAVFDAEHRHIAGGNPTKEYPLHLGVYADRPEVNAIVHLHSDAAVAISCTEPWSTHSAVAPITPYFVMTCGATPLARYAAPGSSDLGTSVRTAIGAGWAALMANHGSITVGTDLASAERRAVELEKTCALVINTATARMRSLSPDDVAELVERFDAYWPAAETG